MEYDFEATRANNKVLLEQYYEAHARCPQCQATRSTTQIYMGYIMIIGREDQYKDENTAICKCGWKGIVDEMMPK